MLNISKVLKPWKEAASLSAQLSLYGFWNDHMSITKSGDLVMVLSVPGVDYESLDAGEQQYAVRRLEAALKNFGEGFHVYQYLFKSNRPEIPFASYGDDVVDAAIDQRRQFFAERQDDLYRVEILYAIVLEGQRSKAGLMAALKRIPFDPQGAMREVRAQFTGNAMKVLLRSQIDADAQKLRTRLEAFTRQLADFMQIETLDQQGQFTFFRRLLNFDDWRVAGKPKTTQFLDHQVVNSDVAAERDHLRIGDHFVRLLTMKEAVGETRPMVLNRLLKINANFHVVTEWTPVSNARAKKEITLRRRHFNMAKSGFFSARQEKRLERDQLIDESKQADIEQLGDCLRALGEGQSMGDFSLTVVLNALDLQTLTREVGEFAGMFTNADGSLFAETYNQLNALFATVPGNYIHNLRKLYLLNSNYADLSFLFTIHPGDRTNAHLDSEYLAVMETENATPYFLNLHNGEVAHTLITGRSGSGKTSALSTIREAAEQSGYAVEGFAPTSKASNQLRDAGISATTLQSFLKRGGADRDYSDPDSRHLYILDESSLASTRQMRDFLDKIGPQDRVLVIGDTRQHQGVDAGKPFEQMQDAGMQTAQLDKIVRQRDPQLLAAVEKLSRNETAAGVAMLRQQGRVREVQDREERISAIARDYAARPENTIIVSPDNASRREINRTVRSELQERELLSRDNHHLPTLIPRSELTGADRQWAARYHEGDVLHYNTGSKELGLKRGSYANVMALDAENNRITVRRQDGQDVTYDPKRLQGVSAYQEIGREFAAGDRIQFTAPSRELGVANRDLATIDRIYDGRVTAKLDGRDQVVTFQADKMRHFDHGYAVTSHSSQGVTADRVLVNMDTRAHPDLINTRFAYVSVSRASQDAQIYTNDAAALGQRLSHDASKSSAVDFRHQPSREPERKEKKIDNDAQHGFRMENSSREATKERIYTPAEHERHYAPINRELHADDARHFGWVQENGTVQSYQHTGNYRHIYIDGPSGQFYDQQKNALTQQAALDRAMGPGNHHAPEPAKVQEAVQSQRVDQSIGL